MALSVGLPLLPVRKHAALWCSDFPPSGSYDAASRSRPIVSPDGDHPLCLPEELL